MSETAEIAKFDALAADWWQQDGAMAMLHAMHPARMRFIREQCDALHPKGFDGLAALDVGCGGGITAESLARLGFDKVSAVDASAQLIATAQGHSTEAGLAIDYHRGVFADFAAKHLEAFDIVCALEVIEHVSDQEGFLADCAQCLRSGGLLVLSTINRTAKSFLLAIGLAEYALRLLPIGTHDWQKFIKPSEILACLPNFTVTGLAGMLPTANLRDWLLHSKRVGVNYVVALQKP
ncbi:MAG: bifunctional 2-polyprenyl-6-hydroxyphenol methylase/3-demethylubiquinol 3-O-methyltransferase UbiG [Alphaproteobacteria bacterium]|nr:bifunctional 2-polyprenyl-6-hydroxyphenol methylase/3-demethylubiquinol 3-O-methyltransferase UbiG [Alphaproteobacteria bacterium]